MSEPQLGPIDESLRRSFAPPDLSSLAAAIDEVARAHTPRVHPRATRRRPWAVAAAVAIAAALVVFVWRANQTDSPDGSRQSAANRVRQAVGAELALFVNERKLPAVADGLGCRAVRSLPTACTGLSRPWLPAHARLDVVGECGAVDGPPCESSGLRMAAAVQLRLQPAGTRFFVCVTPLAEDPRPLLPADSGVRLFRRELGAYVIYEITPLPRPWALPLFKL